MTVTKEAIEQRLQETEVRFNAAKIAKDQAEAELEDRNNECLRLQGEFRALKQLAEQLASPDSNPWADSFDATGPKPEVRVKGEPKQEASNGAAK